jgi:hypothetical protein
MKQVLRLPQLDKIIEFTHVSLNQWSAAQLHDPVMHDHLNWHSYAGIRLPAYVANERLHAAVNVG